MMPEISVDFTEFQKAFREHSELTKRSLANNINTKLYFVARAAARNTPKVNRAELESDLGVVGYKLQFKKNGQLRKRQRAKIDHAITKPAALIYLLVQAARRKSGQKGLYGAAMRGAVNETLKRRIRGIGTLRKGWFMGIKQLGRAAGIIDDTPNPSPIRIKGASVGTPAIDSWNPEARIEYKTNARVDGQLVIHPSVEKALAKAFADETRSMEAYIRAKRRVWLNGERHPQRRTNAGR
jgi:hypothetical protein